MTKADVKFDFKIKGQKPVVTKEICQFSITGADFKEEDLVAVLTAASYAVTTRLAAPLIPAVAPATLATLFSAVPLSAPPPPRDLPHAAATATASIVAAAR